MRRYWMRILLGAVAIFGVGMVLVSVGRRGVDHVKQVAMQQSFNLTPGIAPFQVGDLRLGALTRVSMAPQSEGEFPLINLTVALDSGHSNRHLADCVLIASDAEALKGSQGLQCVQGVSLDSLVRIGSVRFLPGDEEQGIYISASQMAGNPWFKRVTRVPRVQEPPGKGGSFNLQANAAGAFMLIKDEKGRPVFQLNADSQGAYIHIRDSNGADVVRFRADSQGVTGQFNSE